MSATKIKPKHLSRRAIVYLRQSTLRQVVEHGESTARQYALAARAETLGWSKGAIEVIDEDLGQSGASTEARSGFRRLAEDVGKGQVGALLALEVSRFARSSADWHHLLDLCGWGDVLIIDEQGTFDPKDPNDRLLLGLKGQMSEAERYWMRLRMHGAKLSRARRGELPLVPPAGYVWDDGVGCLTFDPDEQVRGAIGLVFERFRTEGSAHGVQRWFIEHGLKLPVHHRGEPEIRWANPRPKTILDILHNPIYTGAYVYGRRESRTGMVDGVRRTIVVPLPREQWRVFLPDRHPPYILWEQYVENEDKLRANVATAGFSDAHGAALDGAALLQGLALCGRCGSRMHSFYNGRNRRVVYKCRSGQQAGVSTNSCWSVAGTAIDEQVAVAFLETAQPPELELALAVSHEAERQADEIDEQWRLRIERARYEARHAERRYKAVDPDNRVVARTLEAQWEGKLRELADAEREHERARARKKVVLSDADRQRILSLARDLPRVWRSPSTTNQQRKNLLRILLREVTLTPIDVPRRETRVQVLWESGTVTQLYVPRDRHVNPSRAEAVNEARIRDLVEEGLVDDQIVDDLNRAGRLTGKRRSWDRDAVARVRRRLGVVRPGAVPAHEATPDRREDGLYSTRGVANHLGVPRRTVTGWAKAGHLEIAEGGGRGRPAWYKLDDRTIQQLEVLVERAARLRDRGAS